MTTNPDSAIPPSYRAQDTGPQPSQLDVPPPAYTFPETFKIGVRETTGPLVTTLQLQGHLGLLKLFWDLRQKVESNQDDRVPTFAKALEPELRWAWFVTLAMDRFERWVKTRTENIEAEYSQPPIDVVMVWHAYLLNPGCVVLVFYGTNPDCVLQVVLGGHDESPECGKPSTIPQAHPCHCTSQQSLRMHLLIMIYRKPTHSTRRLPNDASRLG